MNRVLEQVFPSFTRHAKPGKYYSQPEGSRACSFLFRVVYNGSKPIADGRVILFFAPRGDSEPRFEAFELDALNPIFAKDVQDLQPGDVVEFESAAYTAPDALGFVPADLSRFTNELFVQALVNSDVTDPDANTRPGNFISKPIPVSIERIGAQNIVQVIADQAIPEAVVPPANQWIEYVSMKSDLLSKFQSKDVYITASVVLPKDYLSSVSKKYPTVYYIEGFTGTESYVARANAFLESEIGNDWKAGDAASIPMVRVTLGSRAQFGHTSFADSAVNGPWGTALVSEFIPFLESKFPVVSSAHGRFLHGHSSGGWSSLWLQLQFPEFFGGTWSTAPDPVDFSKFQVVNIYEATNMYWDTTGRPYPTNRCDGQTICTVRDENLVERVYGRGNGGQWDAFCSVFGPRDEATGLPIPLFDKMTGAINHSVLAHWAKYDICKFLASNSSLLSTKLRNKVHVICGVEDNYYLNGACETLQRIIGAPAAPNQPSGAVVNYVDLVPGDHTTIRTRAHYRQIFAEIARTFQQSLVSQS